MKHHTLAGCMIRTVAGILMIFAALPLRAAWSIDEIPNVHLADSTRFVSNPSGVLSDDAVRQLDAMLAEIWRTTSAEPVVVAIDEADMDDVPTFATKLFEKWGIGKSDKDNGLLLLISRDQRRVELRTGQGMEGVITDAYASRLIRNVIAPVSVRMTMTEGCLKRSTLSAIR